MINGIAIIGHGPSLQNSGMGKYIDSFKYVTRIMHRGEWQKPKDYGKKTSFICATVGRYKHSIGIASPHTPDCGYYFWSKYRNQKIRRDQKKLIKKHGGEDVTTHVCNWQNFLPDNVYECFTHGTAAVCIMAHKIRKPIVILGCDLLKDGIDNPKRYIGSWVYEKRKRRTIGHSLSEERKLIDLMAWLYNIQIIFI